MRNPFLIAGLAILATATLVLVFFGDSGSIVGLAPDDFAQVAQLSAIALLVGSALLLSRHRINMRLWHAAAWLAVLVALMAGYQYVGGGGL